MIKIKGPSKYITIASFISMMFVFIAVLMLQNFKVDPDSQLMNLQESNSVVQLQDWDVEIFKCKSFFPKNCELLSKSKKIELPSLQARSIPNLKNGNLAVIRKTIDSNEKYLSEFLGKNSVISLVIPKQVAQRTTISSPVEGHSIGQLIDSSFSFSRNDLLRSKEIVIDFNYQGFDSFGPADIAIALTTPNNIRKYYSISNTRDSEALLTRQLQTGLPMVLSAIALVIDHVNGFQFMSIFGSLYGVRSFIYSLDRSQDFFLLIALINILYLPALIVACLRIIRIRLQLHYILTSLAVSILIQSGLILSGRFMIYSDSVTDGFSALYAIISIILLAKYYEKREDQQRYETPVVVTLVLLGLTLSLISNFEDIRLINYGQAKDFTSFGHFALIPCIAVASLINVGPMIKFIHRERRLARERAYKEKDLQLARELQNEILCPPKGKFAKATWRVCRWPSSTLSGDAHDISTVELADGRKFLAFCIIDITGHGIGPALYVGTPVGTFQSWARGLHLTLAMEDQFTKEEILVEAPEKISESMSNFKTNLGGSAVFGLIDFAKYELTYCLAGHPGLFLEPFSNPNQPKKYLHKSGERIGHGWTEKWESQTIKIEPGTRIIGYTDGILAPGAKQSTWSNRIVKRTKDPLPKVLLNQMKLNKRMFRKDHEKEDDMTLVMIDIN